MTRQARRARLASLPRLEHKLAEALRLAALSVRADALVRRMQAAYGEGNTPAACTYAGRAVLLHRELAHAENALRVAV